MKPKQVVIDHVRYSLPNGWEPHHLYLYKFGSSPYGEEKFKWWKRWVVECWPEPRFVWSRWDELSYGALCGAKQTVERVIGKPFKADYEWWTQVMFSGAAATGKSARAALWMLGNWIVEQRKTSCVLTSTSMEMLRRRIWAELLDWISKSRFQFPLEVVASDTEIRWHKSDSRSAIFGRVVDSGGSIDNAVGRIKGIHNWRVFVAVDEMTAMPEAIAIACRNLDSGTKEFQITGLGNATQWEDQHGIYCQPMEGQDIDTNVDEFWLTKLGGCCIVLDGKRSPAIEDPDRFHFYIGAKKLERDARFFGGENTPEFWRECRGRWPPTGLSNNVMDGALLNQFHVEQPATWKRGYEVGAALDPAFEGGDRRVLQPFRWGEFVNGITGIEYFTPIIVTVDMSQDVRWIHYQIADAVQQQCEQYQVNGKKEPILPRNFIMDTSGEGGGLFSVMSGRWSPEIQSVEFGGAAEKVQMAPDRPTTFYETYGNKVTMLWYVLRRFIEGDQVRGLTDPETRQELTTREKKMKGGKTVVQPKSEMKGMKHRSPDKADAAVIAAEFLRRKGITPAGKTGGAEVMNADAWNSWAAKQNLSDEEHDYADSGAAFA